MQYLEFFILFANLYLSALPSYFIQLVIHPLILLSNLLLQNNILKISFKYLYLCTSLEIGKGV